MSVEILLKNNKIEIKEGKVQKVKSFVCCLEDETLHSIEFCLCNILCISAISSLLQEGTYADLDVR